MTRMRWMIVMLVPLGLTAGAAPVPLSCGPEFAKRFVQAAAQGNAAFCLRKDLPLHWHANPETPGSGEAFCHPPARTLERAPRHAPLQKQAYVAIDRDGAAATCVAAMAVYAKSAQHCRILERRQQLPLSSGLSLNPWHNCVLEYAAWYGDAIPCGWIGGKQAAWPDYYQCLKLVSWSSGHTMICDQIPAAEAALKQACLRQW